MTATILDGNVVLRRVKDELAARVDKLVAGGVTPGLGTVLVGDDAASAKYIEMKQRNCRELGIDPIHHHIPASGSQADLDEVIDRLNSDPAVDAYLVQLPLPPGFDQESTLLRIDPAKDVDGLHPVNLGHLVSGTAAPRPCTPAGIQALLVHYGVPIAGADVVIIGRGLTVGKPLANLLSLKEANANAAVTLLHTGVADVAPYVKRADIVVAAAGSPGIVTADMVKPGAAVVQTGTTITEEGRYLPDVEEAAREVAGWFSPVTGSVGPMTRAMLLTNCVMAAEARALRG